MDDLDKLKTQDIIIHSVEEANKLALSFIPGGAIIDGFLGYHSRLKQKRIIDFSESLKKVLEQFSGRELHGSDFENEDFIDIMESVYKKVQSTKSQLKLERLKNILARQIVYQPKENEITIKIIQLIEELNDIQLLILDCIIENPLSTLGNIHSSLEKIGINIIRDGKEQLKDDSSLQLSEFIVYLKDLMSKGLIDDFEVDSRFATMSTLPQVYAEIYKRIDADKLNLSNSRIVYKISDFGKRFMIHIQSPVGEKQ